MTPKEIVVQVDLIHAKMQTTSEKRKIDKNVLLKTALVTLNVIKRPHTSHAFTGL